MNDLIDRQSAIDYISRALPNWSEEKETAIDCLSNLPTVDAVPVRRGKWVKRPKGALGYICTACGKTEVSNTFDFCTHCGADMREGDKTDGNDN